MIITLNLVKAMCYRNILTVDFLTISDENRLKKKVRELTKKHDEIEIMKVRHEQEIKDIAN